MKTEADGQYWGQDNPKDQARAIISGLRGQVSNYRELGRFNPDNCELLLNHLERLAKDYMPESWD